MKWTWWVIGGVLLGLAIVFVGFMVLTSWEVRLFRATSADRDFSGLVCGTPLDNPGWVVGSPCHGAVNRQLAGSLVLLFVGVALIGVSIRFGLGERRSGRNQTQA